jgi:hypothetical protein
MVWRTVMREVGEDARRDLELQLAGAMNPTSASSAPEGIRERALGGGGRIVALARSPSGIVAPSVHAWLERSARSFASSTARA